jgi:hypothetical protein
VTLPSHAHTGQPWRIHEIAYDFRLVDVWALPAAGERHEFPRLVDLVTSYDPNESPSVATRLLFAVRRRLGGLLGWDDPAAGIGSRVESLRARLPDDLTDGGPRRTGRMPFAPLYLTETEFAAEIANRTVHGVLHLGWATEDGRTYRGQMAILVKPNGLLGAAYLAAIMPFRHLVVYPALLRELEVRWSAGEPGDGRAGARRTGARDAD